MNLIAKVQHEWQLVLVTFAVGCIIGGVVAFTYSGLTSRSLRLAPTPIIRDRVKSVVADWSVKRPPIQDKDDLETIWADTRQEHDFDFQTGGADELCKMLSKEFKNPPTKPVNLQPSNFGPKGKLLTVDDLVQRIEAF